MNIARQGRKRRAAIYVRVSTEAQREEGYSIEAQKKALAAYCTARQLDPYEFYVDGGFSGSTLKRPAMEKLIEDVEKNEIHTVLVYKLDRLSRSQKDTLYLIEDVLNRHDTAFVSLHESMDTASPMGRLMLGILSAFAQLERENIRERTRMGMLERVKNGYWPGGGRTPFGYDYDEEQGILVPNEEAETVREIYRLYLSGLSPQNIADRLGLKYEKLVTQILKRKSNTGVIVYRGKEYPGRHRAIVTAEQFARAMEEMSRRSREIVHDKNHLLTGLVRCGLCGAGMRYQKWGKKGHKLVCYSRAGDKPYLVRDPHCTQEPVWATAVEEAVVRDIRNFSWEYKKEGEAQRDQSAVAGRLSKIERKLQRLYRLYGEEEENDEVLLRLIEETKKQKENILRAKTEDELRQRQIKNRESLKDSLKNIDELWPKMTITEQRSLLRAMIHVIRVTDGAVTIQYKEELLS